MLILTGVAIHSGLQSTDNVELQGFFTELQMVQKRVDVIAEEAKTGGFDGITYDSSTKIYQDIIGTSIQNLTEKGQQEKVDNLKNKKEIYNYTVEDYVQNGKVFHLDGYQNLRTGNDKSKVVWENLSSSNTNTDPIIYNTKWNKQTKEANGLFFTGGEKSYMRIANPIKQCDQFTIEILLKTGSWEGDWRPIITFDTGNTTTSPRLEVTTNSHTQYQWYYGGIFSSERIVANMDLLTTHLLTIVVDENQAKLYDNGKLVYQEPVLKNGTTAMLKTDYINICNLSANKDRPYRGDVFAIRMYNRPLAEGQIGKNCLIDKARYQDQEVSMNSEIMNDYYYYTPEQLEKLGIKDIQQDMLINWETRDVVSVDGFTANQTTYYRDPSKFKPDYQENEKQAVALTEENIKKSGKTVKKIEIMNLKTEAGKEVTDFTLKYRMKDSNEGWITAENESFQTGIPGTYELQVSGDKIVTKSIEIRLEPEIEIEQKVIDEITNRYQIVIHQTFGEYSYPNMVYHYYLPNTETKIPITGNTFEVEVPLGEEYRITIEGEDSKTGFRFNDYVDFTQGE